MFIYYNFHKSDVKADLACPFPAIQSVALCTFTQTRNP